MKNVSLIMFGLIILMFSTVPAQQSLFVGSSSAGVPNQPVLFNCDFFDPIGLPGVEVAVQYCGQSDNEFTSLVMELMNEPPYYLFTYETSESFDENPGLLEFYFSGGTDTLKATQSPKNTSDQFPPDMYKYAPFSADPEGDPSDGSDGNWLDLTGSGMTYSDTKVYGYLDNVSNTWPYNEGLNAYVYALGFVPLPGFDSTLYAMVYANIPFVITPGLYKLNIIDTSFVRLGDIDHSINNDLLHLACEIETFENDPDWPGWPPPEGFLMSLGITLTFGLYEQGLNDFTFPTFYDPSTQFTDFNDNNAPELFNAGFDMVPNISLTAFISYNDQDNNLPAVRDLYFNYGHYSMGSLDHIYDDTSEFEVSLAWPSEGWSFYYHRFSDGEDTVTTPVDSIYISPIGIEDRNMLPGKFSLFQNYPNPFNSSTVISFEIDKPGQVKLSVYDLLGRTVAIVLNDYLDAGQHSISWNARNYRSQQLQSGVYYYRLTSGQKNITKRMVYLK